MHDTHELPVYHCVSAISDVTHIQVDHPHKLIVKSCEYTRREKWKGIPVCTVSIHNAENQKRVSGMD